MSHSTLLPTLHPVLHGGRQHLQHLPVLVAAPDHGPSAAPIVPPIVGPMPLRNNTQNQYPYPFNSFLATLVACLQIDYCLG